ncbi:MAG: Flp pilus assembly complex ATPase component TadA [Phycisphaeraceae bacterium]|nr:Flp pilus assembly complex ATPase component TadA [Phycisphaeraceae bacterium]
MPYLLIQAPEGRRLLKLPDQRITIGRSASNTIKIEDTFSSRTHCIIDKVGDGYVLRDMDSRNGTRVGGELIKEMPLPDGGQFVIGETTFQFNLDDPRQIKVAAAAASAAPEPPPQPAMSGDEVPLDPFAKPARREASDEEAGEDEEELPPLPPVSVGTVASLVQDPIPVLRKLVQLQRKLPFTEHQIELINARGVMVHGAEVAEQADQDASEINLAVRVLRYLLYTAFATRASDLHFEPKGQEMVLRMRVDGSMVEVVRTPGVLGIRLYGVVKVLGDIDIAQRGIVQEGHFSSRVPGRGVDYRVSFTPAMFGQKLVIRVLDSAGAPQHMDDLALPDWMLANVRKVSRQSSGMVLVCGPTGSGKTTTLYAVLRDIDVHQRNVITIEDPVEYQLDGVTQMPINEAKGNTFHSLLRSVLRQDPDVILLGEIRDKETAETAMQAAMTGHLVLSTIHAKDTIGTIFRLLDLGTQPYLVASSLNLVLAQRLIRVLCDNCKAPRKPTPRQSHQLGRFGRGAQQIFYPVGCPRCFNVGYLGRRGVYELLSMSDDLRDAIVKDATMGAIRDALGRVMFTSLEEAGYRMVAEGITSTEEVERTVGAG